MVLAEMRAAQGGEALATQVSDALRERGDLSFPPHPIAGTGPRGARAALFAPTGPQPAWGQAALLWPLSASAIVSNFLRSGIRSESSSEDAFADRLSRVSGFIGQKKNPRR